MIPTTSTVSAYPLEKAHAHTRLFDSLTRTESHLSDAIISTASSYILMSDSHLHPVALYVASISAECRSRRSGSTASPPDQACRCLTLAIRSGHAHARPHARQRPGRATHDSSSQAQTKGNLNSLAPLLIDGAKEKKKNLRQKKR